MWVPTKKIPLIIQHGGKLIFTHGAYPFFYESVLFVLTKFCNPEILEEQESK